MSSPFIECDLCGKKYMGQVKLDEHKTKAHPAVQEPDTAPAQPETPVVGLPPVSEPISEKIVLRFSRAVEIGINGIRYDGRVVECPNMEIASEVVRMAREAYGRDILE